MDLTRYVDRLRADLADAAAAAGGPEADDAARRLSVALDPAFRMSLMEALSDAAAEISAELEQASVEVRLRGREPELVVHESEPSGPPPPPEPPAPPAPPEAEVEGDGTVARVTVRVPEALKNRAEELAAEGSQSLNAWIVQAIRLATRERSIDIDLGSMRFRSHGPGSAGPKRFQGWSR